LGELYSANQSPEVKASSSKKLAVAIRPSAISYTRHERQLENQVVIQEFVRNDGTVFAVAWRGPILPDLSDLLGTYLTNFNRHVQLSSRTRGLGSPVYIETKEVVIHSIGRMRAFHGYAYIPSNLPEGFQISHAIQ
jgi:hypothetical protein